MYADLFTVNREQVVKLCELIIKEGLKIKWTCNSRVDYVDEEMLKLMGKAGCWYISWGIESSNEQILKKKELETKLTEIEAAEEEKRIAHKRKVQTEIDDLANKDLELQIAKLSLQGMKQSKTQEQIDAAILKQRKLTNDAEIKSNEDKFGRGEIDAAAFFKKDAELQTKDTQLTEEQLKATIKAEDEKKQKQKQALDDFGANLEEAGKLSAAAFVASKAYNIANATISTYYGAQEAYSALAGIRKVRRLHCGCSCGDRCRCCACRRNRKAKSNRFRVWWGSEHANPRIAW